jgi:hypothetical protein
MKMAPGLSIQCPDVTLDCPRAVHDWRTSGLFNHGCLDATAFGQQVHAPRVAGHPGALGGCQWNVEVAPSVLAVDAQRTRQPYWHLGHTDEALDITGQAGSRECREV